MPYYEIYFPLTLILKYIFVKMLLSMTFIYICISLKLEIFLKINHRCLKEVIAQLHKDPIHNELVIQMKLSRDLS